MLAMLKRLFNHPGVRRYGANTVWLIAERVYRMALGLFVFTWTARHLGPSEFGILGFSHTFVLLFAIFASLGMDTIVIRELTSEERPRDSILGTALGLKLLGALLCFPLIALSLSFTATEPETAVLIYVIALTYLFQSFNVIDFHFQSKVLSKYVAWGNTAAVTTTSAIQVGLILSDAPLIAFAIVITANLALSALGFVYFYERTGHSIRTWRFEWATAVFLLRESWPMLLSGAVVSIDVKIDQVMLKEMIDSAAVGQYAAAVRLSEATYFIAAVITGSVFPALSRAYETSRERYETRFMQLFGLLIAIGLAIAIPTTALADWLIHILYGPDYAPAASVLVIHIWASIFFFLGVASARWYVLERRQHLAPIKTCTSAALNVGLNLYLIPQFGIVGAAYATLASYSFANVFSYLLHPRLFPLFKLTIRSFNPIQLIRGGLKP